MQTKFGKEKKLFKTDSFRVKYGTIDATKLNAIYIDIESWVEPQELLNFDSNIRITRKNILLKLKKKSLLLVVTQDSTLGSNCSNCSLSDSSCNLSNKSSAVISMLLFCVKFKVIFLYH